VDEFDSVEDLRSCSFRKEGDADCEYAE
jgi:hypothetical protein